MSTLLHENLIPKIVKSGWFQSNINLWLKVSLLNVLLPIHTAGGLVEFNLRPKANANVFQILRASFKEFSEPSSSSVVSKL